MAFIIDENGNYIPVLGESSGGGGGGDVGNGKITINQGGTKKGDFTVNQAGDTTIDLDAGSSYTLPTASTETLGGVKIDGTSITINDGVISSSGTTLSETGSTTQPIYINSSGVPTATTYSLSKSVPADAVFTDTTYSNFTGADGTSAGASGLVPAPSATDNTKFLKGDGDWAFPVDSDKWIPAETTFTVKADGTGDFATIDAAISYFTGKWSNGNITLELKNGTHTISDDIVINAADFYFQSLIIQGESKAGTIISVTGDKRCFFVEGIGTKLVFKTFTTQTNAPSSTLPGLFFNQGAYAQVLDVVANNFKQGIFCARGSSVRIVDFECSNSHEGIRCNLAEVLLDRGTLKFSNIATNGLICAGGGIFKIYYTIKNFTSVTTETNISFATLTSDGMILGFWGA